MLSIISSNIYQISYGYIRWYELQILFLQIHKLPIVYLANGLLLDNQYVFMVQGLLC